MQLLVAAVSAGAAVVSNVAESSSSSKNTKSHTVYGLQDGSGKIHYVGRTTDVGKRRDAHGANPARTGLTMTILADNLTYEAARGVEQTYMLYHHTINTQNKMNNQINVCIRYAEDLPVLRYIVPFSYSQGGMTYHDAKKKVLKLHRMLINIFAEGQSKEIEPGKIYKGLIDFVKEFGNLLESVPSSLVRDDHITCDC